MEPSLLGRVISQCFLCRHTGLSLPSRYAFTGISSESIFFQPDVILFHEPRAVPDQVAPFITILRIPRERDHGTLQPIRLA